MGERSEPTRGFAARATSFMRGEEQNREEGEMVQKSREEGEIRAKM